MLLLTAIVCLSKLNAQTGKIGNMELETFNSSNAKGAAQVAAIKPTSAELSTGDQQLIREIALAGIRQLALSRVAIPRINQQEVKLLAQSELEEQTGIKLKLQEIANAKHFVLPDSSQLPAMDESSGQRGSAGSDTVSAGVQPVHQESNARAEEKNKTGVQSSRGSDADTRYLTESGIRGHQLLEATMTKVLAQAKDPALKALAEATLPVIRIHLKVSQELAQQTRKK